MYTHAYSWTHTFPTRTTPTDVTLSRDQHKTGNPSYQTQICSSNLVTEGGKMGAYYQLAAAAKSLQSCPTLCDPIDGSPQGSPVPGILQARTLEWIAISLSNAWKWKVKMESLSRVRLFPTPWTAPHQAPLSMGFSRQEYWSGSPLPSPITSLRGKKILKCSIWKTRSREKQKGRKWAQDHLLKAISVSFWLIAWNVTEINFFQWQLGKGFQ